VRAALAFCAFCAFNALSAAADRRTRHVQTAGVGSTFPAASVARTRNVWVVKDRPVYVLGDEQAA
jgi:hypothetical protein